MSRSGGDCTVDPVPHMHGAIGSSWEDGLRPAGMPYVRGDQRRDDARMRHTWHHMTLVHKKRLGFPALGYPSGGVVDLHQSVKTWKSEIMRKSISDIKSFLSWKTAVLLTWNRKTVVQSRCPWHIHKIMTGNVPLDIELSLTYTASKVS